MFKFKIIDKKFSFAFPGTSFMKSITRLTWYTTQDWMQKFRKRPYKNFLIFLHLKKIFKIESHNKLYILHKKKFHWISPRLIQSISPDVCLYVCHTPETDYRYHSTCDIWNVTGLTWQVTHGRWQATGDMWRITFQLFFIPIFFPDFNGICVINRTGQEIQCHP